MKTPAVQTEIDPTILKITRSNHWTRAAIVFLAVLPAVGLTLYLSMILASSALRPEVPVGGWVIEPVSAFIGFAALYGTVFVGPLVVRLGFAKRWERQDAALGVKIVPRQVFDWSRPVRATIKCICLYAVLLVVGASVLFSMLMAVTGFVVVSEQGIEERELLRPARYTFDQVRALIVVPSRKRSLEAGGAGPLLRIELANGRDVTVGEKNGLSQDEVDGIVRFLAAKTRLRPTMPRDLLP
jgi:hypothetical protein